MSKVVLDFVKNPEYFVLILEKSNPNFNEKKIKIFQKIGKF
jgi:hypothetical protein